MDTTVTGIGSVVVAELRAAGYMESTIGQYEKTIKALTCFAKERGGTYTPALGAVFASMTISPRTGRFSAQRRFDYRRLVSVFDPTWPPAGWSCRAADAAAVVRDRTRVSSPRWMPRGTPTWTGRGLAPATRDAYGRVARGYLVFLESRGIDCLADADGASVLAFLESLSGRWATVLVVLGGVELPPVPEVHRPHRSGRRGRVWPVCKRSHPILPVLAEPTMNVWSCKRARRGWSARGTRRSPCWR